MSYGPYIAGSYYPNRILNPNGYTFDASGWNNLSYEVAVLADASNDWLNPQSASFDLPVGTIIYVSSTGTIPGGLAAATPYYTLTTQPFKLAATPNGSVIDITSAGTGTVTMGAAIPYSTNPAFTRTTQATFTIAYNAASAYSAFTITKTAAFNQANFVSYPFTIQTNDQGQVHKLTLDYKTSANYLDSYMTYWIRDVTNNTLIQSAPVSMLSGTNSQQACQFQTSINSTSYELIFFCNTPTTTAWTIDVTNVSVTRSANAYGAFVGEWTQWTPVFVGFGTVTAIDCWYQQSGPSINLKLKFTPGTTTAVPATLSLPPGMTVSSQYISTQIVGQGVQNNNGTGALSILATATGTVLNFSNILSGTAINPLSGQNGSAAFASNVIFSGQVMDLAITGLTANQVLSSDTDTRVIAAAYYCSANNSTSTTQSINFDTKLYDNAGLVTASAAGTGTWKCIATVPGIYRVIGTHLITTNAATEMFVYKNGVAFQGYVGLTHSDGEGSFGFSIQLNAGDYFDMRISASVIILGGNITGGNASNIFIERVSGPAQIAASVTVACRYTNTAGTSIANSGDNNVPFATKDYDTTNSFNGTVFTCPMPGRYSVKGTINYSSQTYAVNNQLIASVYKNGALHSYGEIAPIMAIVTQPLGSVVDTTVNCVAGDTIEIRAQNTRTVGATTLNTGAGLNHIEITRGN